VRVDTFDQQSASRVDVLWVVDNSGSMAPRQENLAKNFQSFIDLFVKGAIDFRLAVTTTDIFVDQGQFKGNPKIITPTTPNVTAAFGNNIRVGTTGSPYEAGLAAAKMALDRQLETNRQRQQQIDQCKALCAADFGCQTRCEAKTPIEFLRADAYLYLIFVSDEEDESSEDVRFYWRSFEDVKGIGNDGTVTTAAIMGDVPVNSCKATPGARYLAMSKLTGGEVGSICDTSFAATLKNLATNAVGLKRKFALGRVPNVQTLQVFIRYPCNVADDVVKPCAEVNRDECKDVPVEAYGLLCTPQLGGPDGWSYEPANNVIFFSGDSVPGLHSKVEIQYYEEGKGPE
jgi:hypothetical protein